MSEENKRDPGASEELTASDFVDHADQEVCGPAGAKWFHEEPYREASSHADVTVEERLLLP
jgi:hypothetical protein